MKNNEIEIPIEKMTLLYSKEFGEIKNVVHGETNASKFYGDQDLKKVRTHIIVDKNNFVFENYEQFHVINGELKLKKRSGLDKFLGGNKENETN